MRAFGTTAHHQLPFIQLETKLNQRQRRDPIYTTSGAVQVPLANHSEPAILDRADFDRLKVLGITDQYTLNGSPRGQYVRCHLPNRSDGLVSVARLIIEAGRGHQVKYRDGNRLNLRKGNLYIVAGHGRGRERAAVETLEA